MTDISERFSRPYTIGAQTNWDLKAPGSKIQVRYIYPRYQVLLAADWLRTQGGNRKSFATWEKAACAAIEQAGG